MIYLLSLIFSTLISTSQAISLIQETQNIECHNSQISVFIDKRDRYIEVKSNSDRSQKFNSTEFLDSAILLKHEDQDKVVLLQMTPQNNAILIEGRLSRFTESDCKDTGASKTCNVDGSSMFWSPLKLGLDKILNNKPMTNLDVYHYGVYPNDGTYFLALNELGQAISVIDFGFDLILIYGEAKKLYCEYK